MAVGVLIDDDSIVIRCRVSKVFAEQSAIEVVGQACNGREFVNMASQLQPNVVTVDAEMAQMNGFIVDGKAGVEWLKTKGASDSVRSKHSYAVYGISKAIVDANLTGRALDLDGIAEEIAEL